MPRDCGFARRPSLAEADPRSRAATSGGVQLRTTWIDDLSDLLRDIVHGQDAGAQGHAVHEGWAMSK